MFWSLAVDRFRGFQKLRVSPLDRINLFLGKNNVGKSALLEAIFLLVGPTNPELSLRLSAFRGIEQFRTDPEELWGWLFYKKNLQLPILLKGETDKRRDRQLTITFKEGQEIPFRRSEKKATVSGRSFTAATTMDRPSELDLAYSDGSGLKVRSRAYLKDDGIGFDKGKGATFPNSIFVIPRGGYASDNAERFSKLEEVGEEVDILPPLQQLEPRLKRLSVLVTASGPMIHGDIGLGRMVPIPLMGDGIGRLLTLLLAIVSSRGGSVMVDEIETGFHYAVMPAVWSAIADAARKSDVQVFATTHSFECLKSAYESFVRSAFYDFQLHRLERMNDNVEAIHYDKDMIETAMMSGLELR